MYVYFLDLSDHTILNVFYIATFSRHNIPILWNWVANECGIMQEVSRMLCLYCTTLMINLLDNYVHQLVQTKAGRKMVEVSGTSETVSVQEFYLWWQLIRIIIM